MWQVGCGLQSGCLHAGLQRGARQLILCIVLCIFRSIWLVRSTVLLFVPIYSGSVGFNENQTQIAKLLLQKYWESWLLRSLECRIPILTICFNCFKYKRKYFVVSIWTISWLNLLFLVSSWFLNYIKVFILSVCICCSGWTSKKSRLGGVKTVPSQHKVQIFRCYY